MIDTSKGDTIVDYRKGDEAVVQGIRDALNGRKLQYAYDAVSEKGSVQNIAKVVDTHTGKATFVLPPPGGWGAKFSELGDLQQSAFVSSYIEEGADNFRLNERRKCARSTERPRFRLLPVLHTGSGRGLLPRSEAGGHSWRSQWRAEGTGKSEERRR